MSEFEFLAVLLSIVFGLALTHVLSGVIGATVTRTIDDTTLMWTLWVLLVMILNWWTIYPWSEYSQTQVWSFEIYLALILWATAHYVMATLLYAPDYAADIKPAVRRRWFLGSAILVLLLDMLVTAVRGALFEPWYYLPFVGHYALLAAITLVWRNPVLERILAWYFFSSLLVWALLVRRLLT